MRNVRNVLFFQDINKFTRKTHRFGICSINNNNCPATTRMNGILFTMKCILYSHSIGTIASSMIRNLKHKIK